MADSTAVITRPEVSTMTLNAQEHSIAVQKAALLAKSEVIPSVFRDKPANVMVALEYANRLGCSALAVMQNLDVIHGRPSLRASFLIGTVNASGRFSPIRYRWQGEEGTDSWGCRAVAKDRESGEECIGPLITIGLAKSEGWYGKAGSKWKTIPELMMTYRAGAWWTRIYCPELSLGLQTTDEAEDIGPSLPSPQQHARNVAAALAAPDPEPVGPDYETVTEDEEQQQPPVNDRDAALNRKYFAMLKERGMDSDADRRPFQARLHANGLTRAESCSEWHTQDYRSAIAELNDIPLVSE